MQAERYIDKNKLYVKSILMGFDAIADSALRGHNKILDLRSRMMCSANAQPEDIDNAIKETIEDVKRNVEWIFYDD